ncbi:MAG: NUDIX domain-containing protein [Chloroflexi bacterium]|nr:NUDIX domain-containing protein [Chloroflexota bacterium]
MSFNFCPNCGARLPSNDDAFAPQKCAQCGRTSYHNSKPCAGALIVQENRVLLVLRAVEPFKGCWDIPGGFLEAGEHPRDGMLREVKEETGLDVRVIELLSVYMDRYAIDGDDFFTLNHYYIVEPIGGTLRAADEVSAYRWFPIDAPPNENEIAFEHARVVLRDLRAYLSPTPSLAGKGQGVRSNLR